MPFRPAAPPSEMDTPRALALYLDRASTPREESRIHCAVEAFPYRISTLQSVDYDAPNGTLDFLLRMEAYGWKPIIEDNAMIGIRRGLSTMKLQEGNRLRIACTHASTLHEAAAEFDSILAEVNHIGEEIDLGFLGIGFHPTARADELSDPPGTAFRLREEVAAADRQHETDMLRRSCAARVTLTYADEADMVKKFRVATALQPVITALFASSPFIEGAVSDAKSTRMRARATITGRENSLLPLIFSESFGFETFAAWAADQPMLCIKRDGHYHAAKNAVFRSYIDGTNPDLAGQHPAMEDWEMHLKNILCDINLGEGMTLHGADAGPSEMVMALSALWTGLFYDHTALEGAWNIIKGWTHEQVAQFRLDAPKFGLESEINDTTAGDLAQRILKLAMNGLRRRANRLYGGPDEGRYLQVLFDYTESGKSRADMFRLQQQTQPDFDMRAVFDSCRLQPPPSQPVPLALNE